jgi:hypothetical protein
VLPIRYQIIIHVMAPALHLYAHWNTTTLT